MKAGSKFTSGCFFLLLLITPSAPIAQGRHIIRPRSRQLLPDDVYIQDVSEVLSSPETKLYTPEPTSSTWAYDFEEQLSTRQIVTPSISAASEMILEKTPEGSAEPTVTAIPSISATNEMMPAETSEESIEPTKEPPACFPSNALVTLSTGKRIPISKLAVGDFVKTAHNTYSPVLLFTHADDYALTTFVVLETANGARVAASPSHYLRTSRGMITANDLTTKDLLIVISDDGQEYFDRIVSTNTEHLRGLYNPQTASGLIMVSLDNNYRTDRTAACQSVVQATTYTSAFAPAAAHAALSPLRAVYELSGKTLSRMAADSFVSAAALDYESLLPDTYNKKHTLSPYTWLMQINLRLILLASTFLIEYYMHTPSSSFQRIAIS